MALGDGLRRLVASLGIGARLRDERALRLWPVVADALLGASVAPGCKALRIRRGELLVSVAEDAVRHRVLMERGRLVDALNRAVGSEQVSSIRLVR